MLKRFSTYLLSLVTIGVLAHEKNDGTTYLDSLVSQLEIAEKVQRESNKRKISMPESILGLEVREKIIFLLHLNY